MVTSCSGARGADGVGGRGLYRALTPPFFRHLAAPNRTRHCSISYLQRDGWRQVKAAFRTAEQRKEWEGDWRMGAALPMIQIQAAKGSSSGASLHQ